jgi:hypothetical protein
MSLIDNLLENEDEMSDAERREFHELEGSSEEAAYERMDANRKKFDGPRKGSPVDVARRREAKLAAGLKELFDEHDVPLAELRVNSRGEFTLSVDAPGFGPELADILNAHHPRQGASAPTGSKRSAWANYEIHYTLNGLKLRWEGKARSTEEACKRVYFISRPGKKTFVVNRVFRDGEEVKPNTSFVPAPVGTVRGPLSSGTGYLKPTSTWCHMDHFDVEKMLRAVHLIESLLSEGFDRLKGKRKQLPSLHGFVVKPGMRVEVQTGKGDKKQVSQGVVKRIVSDTDIEIRTDSGKIEQWDVGLVTKKLKVESLVTKKLKVESVLAEEPDDETDYNVPAANVDRPPPATITPTPMKTFKILHNIGRCRLLVSFHDGETFHRDGSPFFDVRIVRGQRALNKFLRLLQSQGYVQS